MTSLLESVGFRWTLRIWSGILLVFGGVAMFGAKARLPIAPSSSSGGTTRRETERPSDLSFMKNSLFLSTVRADRVRARMAILSFPFDRV